MKIAAAYINTEAGNISANLRETLCLLREIEKERIHFVLFPELSLSGYIHSTQEIAEIESHKKIAFSALSDFSKNSELAFAIGFPEFQDHKIYIAHYLFSKGVIIGSHRKSHLGPTEKEHYQEGDELPVFQIKQMTIGIQLCFETHFPEISYAQAKQGAHILAMAFASPKENGIEKSERFKRFLCARAYDNSCYVLACNLAGKTTRGTTLSGLAMIIDPKGEVLAETTTSGSGYCVANFEPDRIEKIHHSKMAWFNGFKRSDFLKKIYE